MELYELTIHALQKLLETREVSAEEVVRSVLTRIDHVEDRVGAFITITDAGVVLEEARKADRMRRDGQAPPLAGIPISVKDVLCTKGLRTTSGSKILEPYLPVYDATVVEKVRSAGMVIVGKNSMDEFAMGSSSENCAYGVPRNPWNLDYICGGSSGGSAAAVAAGESIASLGSDTGGSIRQPASHCGIVGLKPTYGRVSRFGLIAFASSLDQIGPLTKDVRDCALMMNVIAGYDPRDSTSVNTPAPDYTAALTDGLAGVRVGLPKEYFIEGLSPDVESAIRSACKVLQDAGAELVEVSLPHTKYCVAVYYLIAPAEASSNLARYDGVKYGLRDAGAGSLMDMYRQTRAKGFGPEVKKRIIIGTYALSSGYYDAYYRKASQVRTLLVEDFKAAFQTCDVLVSPVAPTPAWRIGEKMADPLSVYLSDILTISTNLAGLPGISVPCGLSSDGLPIGLQIQAGHFQEEKILRVAHNFEQRADFLQKRPALGRHS